MKGAASAPRSEPQSMPLKKGCPLIWLGLGMGLGLGLGLGLNPNLSLSLTLTRP